MNAQAAIEFAKWLKATHPKIYAQSVAMADEQVARAQSIRNQKRPPGLGQIGPPAPEPEKTGWLSTFMQTAGSLGATFLSLQNQKEQMKINLTRAQQGLAPIDIAGVPVLTTNVQIPPETVAQITQSAGMNINKILLVAGAAFVAFMLFK